MARSRQALGDLVHDELCMCISKLKGASQAVRLLSVDANGSGGENDGEGEPGWHGSQAVLGVHSCQLAR